MKIKVSSSFEHMKNLEVGQLGVMIYRKAIQLAVFVGYNDLNMKCYFYLLGPLAGKETFVNAMFDESYLANSLDKQYLYYFMPKMVDYTMKTTANTVYLIACDDKRIFDTLDLPKIDVTTWYMKSRMIDNRLPELCSRLSIWDAKYVKPKDLVVRKIYVRKGLKNYCLFVYMGKHTIKGEERYILVKYDDAATYADYMTYIASNTANVVAFKQAPTNCVELDDIQDANIKASQASIRECRKNRMIQ